MNNLPSIVLAVSQDPNKTHGSDGPQTEFLKLAKALDAPVVGNTGYCENVPLLRRFENSTALDFSQALHILRTYPQADAYVSMSERVGIPLGVLLKSRKERPAHIMIAHRLGTRAKRILDRIGKWHNGVDKIITLCGTQDYYAQQFLPGKTVMVKAGLTDDEFFCPADVVEEDYVLSVGNENRDYQTLIEAVKLTGVKLKVLSSSPWCRKGTGLADDLGDQVEPLPRVPFSSLVELYQKAKLVVVPLNDVDYAAGLNGVLEAYCTNNAVIVTSSCGIMDYVAHMETAYVVPASDVEAMASAINTLFADDNLRNQLKKGAARAVEQFANLNAFTESLKQEIVNTI